MSVNKDTVALVEASLLTALTVIIAIGAIYLPFLGYLSFIIAVPFVILSVRHSLKYAAIATIATAILVALLSYPTYGIYVATLGGFVGNVMGYSIKKNKDNSTVIFYSSLVAVMSLMIMISIATLISGISLADMVDEMLSESISLVESMGLGERLAESGILLTNTMEIFKMIIPSTLILTSAIFASVNYFISSIILKRMGMKSSKQKTYSEFLLPSNILFGATILLILTYLVGKFNIVDSQVLFINILNLFIYVFLIQGIAVIFYFIDKRKLGKGIKILSGIIIFFTGMLIFVSILGWLDCVFDFRKLKQKNMGV